jgi:hypothetical protein
MARLFQAALSPRLKPGACAPRIQVTRGPWERNMALDRHFDAPTLIHDGMAIAEEAEEIALEHPCEQREREAQLPKECAVRSFHESNLIDGWRVS